GRCRERGWTGGVIRGGKQEEILGTLTLLSLRVERPIGAETLAAGLSIAGPTALALDNARLQQQRKEFTEAMQNALLPRSEPELPGLEAGGGFGPAARARAGG